MSSAKNTGLISETKCQFHELAQNAGKVESLLRYSERKVFRFKKHLREAVEAGIVALRAARKLDPDTPSVADFEAYVHLMVTEAFKDATTPATKPAAAPKK